MSQAVQVSPFTCGHSMHGESRVCPEFRPGDDYKVCRRIWQTSETTRARRPMGSAGSAKLDTSVHDYRWLRRVTDQCSVTAAAAASRPAVTHQSSTELASLEQAAMTLNDSNAVSCTVLVFAGNEAVPFPGIREWKMTGIPGRPGMQTLNMSNYKHNRNTFHKIMNHIHSPHFNVCQ